MMLARMILYPVLAVLLPVVFYFINRKYIWLSIISAVVIELIVYWDNFSHNVARGPMIILTLAQIAVMAIIIRRIKRVDNPIVPILIIAALVVIFAMFTPYKCIERYVERNKANLTSTSELYLEQGSVNNTNNRIIDADGIYGDTYKIVQYYYWGIGIAPSSTYYGFYYSPDDVPVPYCNGDYELTENSGGTWSWSGEGDNGGEIKKISDKWYYYEAWF